MAAARDLPHTIRVDRRTRLVGRGALRPFADLYECVGPDGTRFTNTSRAELLGVLKRHYGRGVTLDVVDLR